MLIGAALSIFGVLALYGGWRRSGAARSARPVLLLLGAGWLALIGATIAFMSVTSPERGLSFWIVAFMLAGLAATLTESARAGGRREVKRPLSERDYLEPLASDPRERARRRQRIFGRLAGALVISPALALASAALWQLAGPGALVDRIVVSGFVLMAVFAGAIVFSLSARRPWLGNLMLAAPAIVASTGVAALAFANGAAS